MSLRIVIRVDASLQTGTGHFMRCLALAQAIRRAGGDCEFLMAENTETLDKRLKDQGFVSEHIPIAKPGASEDAALTVQAVTMRKADWVVVDGYHFGSSFQKTLKKAGLQLLLIDDYNHGGTPYADVVLNQNLHASLDLYPKAPESTHFLLGEKYVLLREEFLKWQGTLHEIPVRPKHLLIVLGGTDPKNETGRLLDAVKELSIPDLTITVIIGPRNPHGTALQNQIQRNKLPVIIRQDVQDIPDLLRRTDLALTSGGTTIWELAFMGVPALVGTLVLAEEFLVEGLRKIDLFEILGPWDQVDLVYLRERLLHWLNDAPARQGMSRRGQAVIDGLGGARVVECLQSVRVGGKVK